MKPVFNVSQILGFTCTSKEKPVKRKKLYWTLFCGLLITLGPVLYSTIIKQNYDSLPFKLFVTYLSYLLTGYLTSFTSLMYTSVYQRRNMSKIIQELTEVTDSLLSRQETSKIQTNLQRFCKFVTI